MQWTMSNKLCEVPMKRSIRGKRQMHPRGSICLTSEPAIHPNAPHSGTGVYGQSLKKLATEERCAYLDMTTPWAKYIRSANIHPHIFYRDRVHANEYGEQILSKILMAFWKSSYDGY